MFFLQKKLLVLLCLTVFFRSFLFAAEKSYVQKKGFIENRGQILNQHFEPNKDVLFLYASDKFKVHLKKNGYSYETFTVNNITSGPKAGNKFSVQVKDLLKTTISSHRVDISFLSANPEPDIVAEDYSEETYNYFISGQKYTGIRACKKVTYKNIYPFTDIEFIITNSENERLKYNIILKPGADLGKVKFLVQGASEVITTPAGNICFKTSCGNLTEAIPLSFYSEQPQTTVNVKQELNRDVISFSASYDISKTLVIDPSTNIIWGTYFGGNSLDNCNSVGTDASGNVYLAGHTLSTSNIATSGVYQSTLSGSYDVYLAKFNSSGALIWSTYFGGPNLETAYAMFVESNGTVYVCGDTASPTGVASSGAHQTTYGGGIDDATLIKFDSNGQLIWATYYGGNQHDIAYALTLDNSGNPIISGHTESSNTSNCIATPGAYSTAFVLSSDVFVAKFNSNGVRLWGTYYGDTGFEEAWGMKCDAADNVIITGFSSSLSGLSTPPCHQSFSAGGQDAFIAKFNSAGNALVWATYFGGSGDEQGTAVEIDNSGTIFISGNTTSPSGISTPGTYQTTIASSDDGFITAFTPAGAQIWGTYFGGGDTDYINSLKLDASMNLVFCGETLSANGISTASAYQPSIATINSYDAYFAKFSNTGVRKFATYYGGEANDNAKSLTMGPQGIVYLCGETTSTVGISTPGSYMPVYGTTGDGFLARFCMAPEPQIMPAGNATICMNVNYTLTTQAGYPSYFWNTGNNTNSLVLVQPLSPGIYTYVVTANDSYGCNGTSDTTQVTVNNCTTGTGNQSPYKNKFVYYPVPVSDYLHIEVPGFKEEENYRFELYNAEGRCVKKINHHMANETINMSAFAPGIYFIKLYTESGAYSAKIIKD